MHARSLNLLAKMTVVKNASSQGFQELVRQHMLRFAPRDAVEQDAVEETRSTTHASPDDLACLAHVCGALAGQDPLFHHFLQRRETRLRDIIRDSLTRIQALRQTGEKRFDETTPAGHTSGEAPYGPAGGAHCAPEP